MSPKLKTGSKPKKRTKNPLLIDPTRTATLRRRLITEFDKRFNRIRARMVRLIAKEDAFGLKKNRRNPFTVNLKFAFQSDPEKLTAFQGWLAEQMEQEGLTSSEMEDLLTEFIEEGFQKGQGRAYDDVMKKTNGQAFASAGSQEDVIFYQGSRSQFLHQAFNRPAARNKVKLLVSRTFEDLKGVTSAMATQINRKLAEGFVQGDNPFKIAKELSDTVNGIGRVRARTIARTEIVRAHAEGQLDALEQAGVAQVGVMVEWSTAEDEKVCPRCIPLNGIVVKLSEAHGLIPRHPNCRCAFIPANVGEDTKDQIRPPVAIQKARNKSVLAERGKNFKGTLKEAKALSTWPGADTKISPLRPKSVIDVPIDEVGGISKTTAKQKQAAIKKKAKEEAAKKKAEEAALAKKAEDLAKKAAADALAKKLAQEAAEKAAKEAAEKAAREAAETYAATVRAAEEAGELPALADLEFVSELSGSTRPKLMKNRITGKKWVMKSTDSGIAPDHLRSEALADDLYRAMGAKVPRSGIVESAEGPTKLSEFLDGGQTLQNWSAGKSKAEIQKIYDQLEEHFVADALLANHDVVGLSMDNIFIVDDVAYRIDNGGALFFRAQGAAKANFNEIVDELDTLRDAAVNSNTAKVFAGIDQEKLLKQIDKIAENKKAILDVISRETHFKEAYAVNSRIVYLKKMAQDIRIQLKELAEAAAPKAVPGTIPKGVPKTAQARAKARMAEPGVVEGTARRVKDSRINGVAIKGDRDLIEDANVLAWEEVDVNGNVVTKIQLKLTPKGSQIVDSNITAGTSAPTKVAGPGRHPQDEYWEDVLAGAKTVSHHASDGDYNKATIAKMEDALDDLTSKIYVAEVQDEPVEAAVLEMWTHYSDAIHEILDAKKAGKASPAVREFVFDPAKYEKVKKEVVKKSDRIIARKEEHLFPQSVFDRGYAQRVPNSNDASGWTSYIGQSVEYRQAFEVEDVAFKYSSSADWDQWFKSIESRSRGRTGTAFKGHMEITVPGEASSKNLKKGLKALERLGVDTTPPTPEYDELVYLHKTVYLRKDHQLAGYKKIWDDPTLTDKEKVAKIKKWAEKRYDVDFADLKKRGLYNPEGYTNTSFGDGWRHWDRWDMSPEQIEKDMAGYTLGHSSSLPPDEFVDKFLASGGEITPTAERVRKGVSISGGMSPDDDLRTGGADYFFTRIRSPQSPGWDTIRFKVDRLRRADIVSHDDDEYGNLKVAKARKFLIDDWKRNSGSSTNETNFKKGLSLLDDIDHMVVQDLAQKDEVVEAFHRNKVYELPDGRKVEEVVFTKYEADEMLRKRAEEAAN